MPAEVRLAISTAINASDLAKIVNDHVMQMPDPWEHCIGINLFYSQKTQL